MIEILSKSIALITIVQAVIILVRFMPYLMQKKRGHGLAMSGFATSFGFIAFAEFNAAHSHVSILAHLCADIAMIVAVAIIMISTWKHTRKNTQLTESPKRMEHGNYDRD